MGHEQLSLVNVPPVNLEPDVATIHAAPQARRVEIPDFRATIIVKRMLPPEPNEASTRENEVERRNAREDTLDDHTSLGPQQSATAAGTIIRPREFRKPVTKKRRPFSPRELARGDKGTDFNTQ